MPPLLGSFTAVYRLWQIGYIDEGFQEGTSLGMEPWIVVITSASYVGGYWFGVSPPVAIAMGAVLGLIWCAVVSAWTSHQHYCKVRWIHQWLDGCPRG